MNGIETIDIELSDDLYEFAQRRALELGLTLEEFLIGLLIEEATCKS